MPATLVRGTTFSRVYLFLTCPVHACSFFFFSSRRRHTRWPRDWSSDVCSSDLRPLSEAPLSLLSFLSLLILLSLVVLRLAPLLPLLLPWWPAPSPWRKSAHKVS